jgi:glycosyltransferase involved in cell wall biosynthesis
LKIILFTEIYDAGGIDTFIVNLVNNWPNSEDSFVIVANHDYPGFSIIKNKVSRHVEFIEYKFTTYHNLFQSIKILTRIKKYISPIIRYALLCVHIFKLRNLLGGIDADIMMVINGGYPGGDVCRSAAISWKLFTYKHPSIHNFHNIASKSHYLEWPQEFVIDSLLSWSTGAFVTVSIAAAASMQMRPAIGRLNKIQYIHNGFEPSLCKLITTSSIRQELSIPSRSKICMMLATYEPRKGHFFLLNAFKEVLKAVPTAHLIICGFGTPTEVLAVKALVDQFELSGSVHLLEFRSDAEELLKQVDVLLVASQAFESFGYTSIEAMACKVPVVATNIGGIPEVVIDGFGGYCVDHRDYALYAERIIQLLQDDKLRAEQSLLGHERYKNLFTAKIMAQKYAELIKGQLGPSLG